MEQLKIYNMNDLQKKQLLEVFKYATKYVANNAPDESLDSSLVGIIKLKADLFKHLENGTKLEGDLQRDNSGKTEPNKS